MVSRLAPLLVVATVAASGAAVLRAQNPANLQNPANPGNLGNPGNPERGKGVFDKCVACHALDGSVTDGPSLMGVFGRKAGSRDDYRYSPAMVRSGVVWDEASMDAYVTDPQAFIRGNRMSFAGVPDKTDRENLIAYLKQATAPKAP